MHTVSAAAGSLALLAVLLAFAPLPADGRAAAAPDVGLDHVILGIDSLAQGIEEFSRLTGVVPQRGGQHPGRGTENALVSLGDGRYLEILARLSPPPDPGRAARARLTPSGWALHTSDIAGLLERLRGAGFTVQGPSPGSRRTPDGKLLEWQTASVQGPDLDVAPFFIQWGAGTAHPSTTSPVGCTLATLELSAARPRRLIELFRAVGFDQAVRTTAEAAMRLTLDCPKGRVSFPQ